MAEGTAIAEALNENLIFFSWKNSGKDFENLHKKWTLNLNQSEQLPSQTPFSEQAQLGCWNSYAKTLLLPHSLQHTRPFFQFLFRTTGEKSGRVTCLWGVSILNCNWL